MKKNQNQNEEFKRRQKKITQYHNELAIVKGKLAKAKQSLKIKETCCHTPFSKEHRQITGLTSHIEHYRRKIKRINKM